MTIMFRNIISWADREDDNDQCMNLEDLTTEKFIPKFTLGFFVTIVIFAIIGATSVINIIRPINTVYSYNVALLYILLSVYIILILSGLPRYIYKKLHPFSGNIKSYKDVNAFLAHYKYFAYTKPEIYAANFKPEYNYFISTSVSLLIDGPGLSHIKFIFPGVYSAKDNYNINNMIKVADLTDIRREVYENRKYL